MVIINNNHGELYKANTMAKDDRFFRFYSSQDINRGKMVVMTCPILHFRNQSWTHTNRQKKLQVIEPTKVQLTILPATTPTFSSNTMQKLVNTTTNKSIHSATVTSGNTTIGKICAILL